MRGVVLALALLPAPAAAQSMMCLGAPDMLAELAARYGEDVAASALGQSDVRLVVTVNPDTGSWSILVVRPDGKACLAAAGTEWRMLPQGDPT